MLTCPAPALLKQAIHSPSQAQPVDHIPPTSKRPVVIISSSNQYQSFHKSLHKPMNRLPSNALRFDADSMPAPGDNDEVLDAVGGLEGLHDGDDRGGLGPVALPAADLERETMTIDQ